MAAEGTYTTIDATGRSYVAHIGGDDLTFTTALSANLELALRDLTRSRATGDEERAMLLQCLEHMAPAHNGDLGSLFDRLDLVKVATLVGDAARELRGVPFTEAPASSTPAATAGATGAGVQESPPTSTT